MLPHESGGFISWSSPRCRSKSCARGSQHRDLAWDLDQKNIQEVSMDMRIMFVGFRGLSSGLQGTGHHTTSTSMLFERATTRTGPGPSRCRVLPTVPVLQLLVGACHVSEEVLQRARRRIVLGLIRVRSVRRVQGPLCCNLPAGCELPGAIEVRQFEASTTISKRLQESLPLAACNTLG